MTKLFALLCLAVVILACGLLGTGAGVLDYRLPGGVPFGNALTVAGLVAAAAFSRLVAAPGTRLRILSYVALAAAVAWYPVSIAMAGNLNLVFPRGNGQAWTYFTYAVRGPRARRAPAPRGSAVALIGTADHRTRPSPFARQDGTRVDDNTGWRAARTQHLVTV